nr:hypothetical protein HmN_000957000 [Hymenolepis microstoma]
MIKYLGGSNSSPIDPFSTGTSSNFITTNTYDPNTAPSIAPLNSTECLCGGKYWGKLKKKARYARRRERPRDLEKTEDSTVGNSLYNGLRPTSQVFLGKGPARPGAR